MKRWKLGIAVLALVTVGGAGGCDTAEEPVWTPGEDAISADGSNDAVGTDAVGTDAVGTDAVGTDAVDTTTKPDTVGPTTGCLGKTDDSGYTSTSTSWYWDGDYAALQALRQVGGVTDLIEVGFPQASDRVSQEGTYSLVGQELGDCTECVIVALDCVAGQGCKTLYFVDSGELAVDKWDGAGPFHATLQNGAIGRELRPLPDNKGYVFKTNGKTWCLDGFEVSGSALAKPEAPGGPIDTKDVCVPAGNSVYVGANIAQFSLTNCLGEVVDLHAENCGTDKKALRIMATAGWCTACTAHLAEYTKQVGGGMLTRAAIAATTPGLDMYIILAEDNSGGAVSEAYCMAYAKSKNLDPAMVLIDHNAAGVAVPLVSPAGSAINAKGLATTWTHINPYLTANTEGMISSGFPWYAVVRPSNMEYIWSDYVSSGNPDTYINQLLAE